jgi:hypothetical protein
LDILVVQAVSRLGNIQRTFHSCKADVGTLILQDKILAKVQGPQMTYMRIHPTPLLPLVHEISGIVYNL